VTITSITAVSGSSTQPSFSHSLPNWNQGKLKPAAPLRREVQACVQTRKRKQERRDHRADGERRGKLAITLRRQRAQSRRQNRSAGISQRFLTIQGILVFITNLFLHQAMPALDLRVDRVRSNLFLDLTPRRQAG